MARYRVTTASFINGRYVEEDTVIDYDGIPGFNLDPLDEEARSAKKAAGQAGERDVNGRAFQEDLTRSDGTPSALNSAETVKDQDALEEQPKPAQAELLSKEEAETPPEPGKEEDASARSTNTPSKSAKKS
ncbi:MULTISPECIES: hypothetical protein [unclassified Saccharibacter]|uniref:hypothetical protein n=1 Tax=unclassified Saccharibacter TaxID=2648722 RepID=UPI001329FE29|nr:MULTISPECIES: hypothetical protein [unclassified Saccharibacter]MXV35865.1 hypothetical protein [Saccharibacter sp. EH611]MXV57985.1 hypothetical protein [Saccharibacter sp. EH70]MXV66380.1 hypothetical protein [Saccharibacter sp. EH60]